jgi:hypothetical protein
MPVNTVPTDAFECVASPPALSVLRSPFPAVFPASKLSVAQSSTVPFIASRRASGGPNGHASQREPSPGVRVGHGAEWTGPNGHASQREPSPGVRIGHRSLTHL